MVDTGGTDDADAVVGSGLATAARHTVLEDAMAIGLGTLLVAFGIFLYAHAVLLVGGIAGVSLLLHFGTGLPFWLAFGLANLPFYGLALWRMGWLFTLKTVIAVCLVSLFTKLMPMWIEIPRIAPLFAAFLGGSLTGMGMLALFRHRTGIGGTNILALYLQERFGLRAGWLQLGLDAVIMLVALFVLPLGHVALSLIGAAMVNGIVGINHRPGRYAGISREPRRRDGVVPNRAGIARASTR